MADAVVVGAGPNGLVAAVALARAGWDVVVVEANETVGGAVRSGSPWPGVTVDLFSAFYPLAAASPVFSAFDLERFGLSWSSAPSVVAHCARPGDEECPVIHRDPERTAAGFEREAAGDGQTWLDLCAQWRRIREPLLNALFTPFPPVRSGARLVHRLGTADALQVARMATLPVTRLGTELFAGEGPRLLLAGNAMHADIPMDAAGSGLFGWLLCMLAQDVGFPVPRGGAGRLSQALAECAVSAGARIDTGETVTSVVVGGGRALGVRTDSGRAIRARRAVLADVDAPRLFRDLVGARNLPPRWCQDLDRFQWDHPTVKLNWLVDDGIPWSAGPARQVGTVHLGADLRGLARWSADLAVDRHPAQVFALLGQMTTADPSRSPVGTETAWAYTHLPADGVNREEVDRTVRRLEATVEAFAPGFSARVLARTVQRPDDLQEQDGNLFRGAVNAGTAQLHQQLVFRPTLGRPETPVGGLFLAGASAHPGGGVHGACGWIAAQAALRSSGALGSLRRAVGRGVMHLAYGRSDG